MLAKIIIFFYYTGIDYPVFSVVKWAIHSLLTHQPLNPQK